MTKKVAPKEFLGMKIRIVENVDPCLVGSIFDAKTNKQKITYAKIGKPSPVTRDRKPE